MTGARRSRCSGTVSACFHVQQRAPGLIGHCKFFYLPYFPGRPVPFPLTPPTQAVAPFPVRSRTENRYGSGPKPGGIPAARMPPGTRALVTGLHPLQRARRPPWKVPARLPVSATRFLTRGAPGNIGCDNGKQGADLRVRGREGTPGCATFCDVPVTDGGYARWREPRSMRGSRHRQPEPVGLLWRAWGRPESWRTGWQTSSSRAVHRPPHCRSGGCWSRRAPSPRGRRWVSHSRRRPPCSPPATAPRRASPVRAVRGAAAPRPPVATRNALPRAGRRRDAGPRQKVGDRRSRHRAIRVPDNGEDSAP